MIGWMFPGQGSQRAGMAEDLEPAGDLIERASKILGTRLDRICRSPEVKAWPADLLQPALYVTSVAASISLTKRGLRPEGVFGHSLGEFAALTAAGAIDFEDGIKLVAERGRAMAAAASKVSGGMASVIACGEDVIRKVCDEVGDVWVANDNGEGQIVISGSDAGLAAAAPLLLEAGARKVIRLDVPVAAHTPLMEPARERLAEMIEDATVVEPEVPFYSAVDAEPHSDPDDVKAVLVDGVIQPVRFRELLLRLGSDGYDAFVEVGPGRVLSKITGRILGDVDLASAGTDGEADALAFQRGMAQVAP